jgi:hypothetical protein
MVFVTALAVPGAYVVHEASVARMKEARIDGHLRIIGKWSLTTGISWVRQRLGGHAYAIVAAGELASDETVREYQSLFPESKAVRTISERDYWRFICDNN